MVCWSVSHLVCVQQGGHQVCHDQGLLQAGLPHRQPPVLAAVRAQQAAQFGQHTTQLGAVLTGGQLPTNSQVGSAGCQ